MAKPKLVPIKLRRKDGVVQTYYIRGRKRALAHPNRPRPAELREARRQKRRRGAQRIAPDAERAPPPRAPARDEAAPPAQRPAIRPATTGIEAATRARPRAPPRPAEPGPTREELPEAQPGVPVDERPRRVEVGLGKDRRGEIVPRTSNSKFKPLRGAVYDTYFKAFGTKGGSLEDMRGGDSPDLLMQDLTEWAAPAAFYSNQSGILGRVKWPGIRSLEDLIDELNLHLEFLGEELPGFDFRLAYDEWEYTYQILQDIGGIKTVAFHTVDRR